MSSYKSSYYRCKKTLKTSGHDHALSFQEELPTGVKVLMLWTLLVVISACTPQNQQECYQKGYAQGVIDEDNKSYDKGWNKGWNKGYADGYERVYPGSNHQHSGFLGKTQGALAMLGAVKIVVSLGFLIIYLLKRSQTDYQVGGKILMGVIGSILVIWSASAFSALSMPDILKEFLLSPSSETVGGWLFYGGVSASVTYIVFRFVDAFVHAIRGARLEAWCILLASALITILLPTLISVGYVPDINKYFASELLVGVLMGGLYYLADSLLRSRP